MPFAARYRIVDIPLSNSINSGFRKVYVLTQFNSASLHLHLAQTYQFDSFSRGFLEIPDADQGITHGGWYACTSDAVGRCSTALEREIPPTPLYFRFTALLSRQDG